MGSAGLVKGYLENINPDDGPGPNLVELRGKEMTFGRGAGNSVVLASLEVSRRHAIMRYVPESHQWQLKDTSGNGISLNGLKIPKNCFMCLKDGDIISFSGHLVYRFASVRKPEVEAACSRLKTSLFEVQVVDGAVTDLDNRNEPSSADVNSVQILDDRDIRKTRSPEMFVLETSGCVVTAFHANSGSPLRKRKKLTGPVAALRSDPPTVDLASKTGFAETEKRESVGSNETKTMSLFRGTFKKLEREKFELELKYKAEQEELLNKLKTLQSEKAANDEIKVYKKILSLMEEEYACGICTEVYVEASVINCGHTFCSRCIGQWLKQKKECPSCRKTVGEAVSHTEMRNFIARFQELVPDTLKRNSQ